MNPANEAGRDNGGDARRFTRAHITSRSAPVPDTNTNLTVGRASTFAAASV